MTIRWPSDGHPRPQYGSKGAQEGLKRGPREPRDGPKNAQQRSKSAQRGVQEVILEAPEGRGELRTPPPSLIDRLQDGPSRRPGRTQDAGVRGMGEEQEQEQEQESRNRAPPPLPRHALRRDRANIGAELFDVEYQRRPGIIHV